MSASHDSARRDYEVGISVEALAGAWARQEDAPHGAVVTVAHEISARLRGGSPWVCNPDSSMSFGVVIRPTLTTDRGDLLWCAAVAGADDGLETVGGLVSPGWPDELYPAGAVNVTSQLGPTGLVMAIVAVRVDALLAGVHPMSKDDALAAMVDGVLRSVDQLENDASTVLHRWAERSRLVGRWVRVTRLPRGETRGRVVGLDAQGALVIASPTDMLEHISVTTTNRVHLLDEL